MRQARQLARTQELAVQLADCLALKIKHQGGEKK